MVEIITDMLSSPLMVRGLLAALLVGISAPIMGTYLVQRRLALLGDGIGHVALTGVAMGWLAASWAGAANQDQWAIPGAVAASIIGSVLIEVVRSWGRTSGDVALALLFYGGIAGGVLLISIAGGTSANLTAYLFGSIATVTSADLIWTFILAALILLVGLGLRPALFSLSYDEDFARATGLPVRFLNIVVAIVAALTVSVAMRVVGVLLVSAIMIVPVAIAQLVCRSFNGTMHVAMGIGASVAVAGLIITYVKPYSPGATIVVLAITIYGVVSIVRPLFHRPAPHHKHEDEADSEFGGQEPCNA
ncbi:ABC transporter [Bowdeniella nasicola]|uniref:ABC transporter n=1 Tax=Bowdeniella nasicola TaxID=208480 RepID=A0A1Q5Q2J2_9ACTO|nr:metal ABC transporter permease [Bowdeniella nasicola]OKL54068.1 ABC transporter [Bowdeniella nasicola]